MGQPSEHAGISTPKHPGEPASNRFRAEIADREPAAMRTYTPSQAVLVHSQGIYHLTPEGRRLYDFTSGVLVANLGHNSAAWLQRLQGYLGWTNQPAGDTWQPPLTAYNAITPVEVEACRRLIALLQGCPGGRRLEQVLWAASGSEAIQKALWAALARDPRRDIIVATRQGFHGKKGLAGAVSGSETDAERDPRVRFISFPMKECTDLSLRGQPFTPLPYQCELHALRQEFGPRLTALITEPYLGAAGSYHPPRPYLHLLQDFCRDNDVIFILDEIQSSFGRTGRMFAFEKYQLEPDVVVLGKGLANGVPGAAAVGPAALFAGLGYGEGSDTFSGNPLTCAAVCATLDGFSDPAVLAGVARVSPIIEAGLARLKDLPFVRSIRGEEGGMVWGIETQAYRGRSAGEMAAAVVLTCYQGRGGTGIHLLGPLAGRVVRVAPPLVISADQARDAVGLMFELLQRLDE